MASWRLLVLAFVREYIDRWGHSPSYGEIAAGLSSNRTRVRKAVRSLERDGLVLRAPGPRGLTLPTVRDEAVRQLRALGFIVDEDCLQVKAPVTDPPLLPPAALDYDPDPTDGDIAHGERRNGSTEQAGAGQGEGGAPEAAGDP